MSEQATGYFGVPGKTGGKVHAVEGHRHRPICGTRFTRPVKFQWCAPGFYYPYLECERCKKIAAQRACTILPFNFFKS